MKRSKEEKIQQRLEWIRFRLTHMGWEPEEIENELEFIREKRFDKIDPGTATILDCETFNILTK